ncbi:hypothetical protein ACFLU4_01830 [Chloroflexota bacterium]
MSIDYRNLSLEEAHLTVVGLTRVYKGDGVGRWFQKGGYSYQGLSEGERAKILLDGEEVVELDYPAMHPHILYAWEDERCPDGFYQMIAEASGCPRQVAKSMTLFALNARSPASLSSAINLDKAKEAKKNPTRKEPRPILYEELKRLGLKPVDVVRAIIKVHPAIAKYLFGGFANKLMLAESDIMTSVLLSLMGLGIPALPVHDSVVGPARYRETVRRVMEEEFERHTGFGITVG